MMRLPIIQLVSQPLQPQIFNREAGTGWKRRLGNQISTITHLSIFIEKTKLVFLPNNRGTKFSPFSLNSVCPLDLILSFQIFSLFLAHNMGKPGIFQFKLISTSTSVSWEPTSKETMRKCQPRNYFLPAWFIISHYYFSRRHLIV